ncbi:MAG TPA: ATP-binding protein [Nocardioides sp.]|uniref:ATP-binding protein n=1 Tax=Nocardioides sp. TaxID=35761 RepID=UPI002D035A74|nr:ATP-binding protein [Nocardioides sp.]HTW18498.1 ATP-binding protein [Nocardioides sp.]
MDARVIVLAGPSGTGKSRLAERIGLPVLRLDDFYKDVGDPTLPLITEGANAGIVDWDDPDSWLLDDAMAALDELCRTGRADVPIYDIARSGRCGSRVLDLDGSPLFVAEGIFAQEIVPHAREAGLLAAAYCVRRHPLLTFWRRLTRDLREHRKPPLVLVRRGLALMRAQRKVVGHAVALGCVPVTNEEAYAAARDLGRAASLPHEQGEQEPGDR